MTSGPGFELIALAQAQMAAAHFDSPLQPSEPEFGPLSAAIAFKNQHATVEFAYDGRERHFSCTLSLWRRNVDPPAPYRGTQFIVAQLPVALLDLSVENPTCYPTNPKTAVPYWTHLLEHHAQDLLAGDFHRLPLFERQPVPPESFELIQEPTFLKVAESQPPFLGFEEDD